MAAFLANEMPHRAEKLRTCGAWLQFRDYFSVEQVRLTAGRFCQQDRLCGLCACRRGGRYLRAYTERVRAVLASAPLRPYLVTLTVKDGPDLGDRLEHLQRSFRQLVRKRRHDLDNAKRYNVGAMSEMCKAAGGVGSIEIKRGSGSGVWHPHMHAVWLCNDKPDQHALACEWFDITGDSFVVDVRPFHSLDEVAGVVDVDELAGDFCEVFKYALKLGDLSLEDNYEAFKRLQRQRLIEAFGCLRGVEVPADLVDEPLSDDLPYIEILLRYVARENRYGIRSQFFVDATSKNY